MKYAICALILTFTLLAGLTDPELPKRTPVPAEQIVAHSSHCAGCHGFDPTQAALTDADGNDVNMYDDWRISMMGLAAHDPFWRATLTLETYLYPEAKAEIESTCLKCHAPLGSQQRAYDGLSYSYVEMLNDSLGLDGVSCSACHQQPPETYGRSHSGNITLNTDRVLYGPHPKPFVGPMDLYVGFTPVYTDLMYSSGVCAGCHTLITSTLDEGGDPTGDMFVEQATYHEWLNSTYSEFGVECQSCHMPFIDDSILIASGLKGLDKRHPYGLHQFYGANTAMLTLMKDNRVALGLSDTIAESVWNESIDNNRFSLRNAADVNVTSFNVFDDTLYVEVTVINKTGHKLPSGYPSRLAWLQVVLVDDISGDTIYTNGMMDTEGNIIGRDFPYEPHHEFSKSSEDVQIYEMAMSDSEGHLTTRLNGAFEPLKDNRLLPAGFSRSHPTYDTVAVWGEALGDVDYDAFSSRGRDVIEYRIPLDGFDAIADLHVALQYHTFPARWMEDLFEHEIIAEVSQFKAMYDGYETVYELIDSVRLHDLNLEISGVTHVNRVEFVLFPNPVLDGKINVIPTSEQVALDGLTYELIDVNGVQVKVGAVSSIIQVGDVAKGIYFIRIFRKEEVLFVNRLLVL